MKKIGILVFFVICMSVAWAASLEGLPIPSNANLILKQTNGPNENQPWEIERFKYLKLEFAKIAPNVQVVATDTMFDRQMYAIRLSANTMEDAFLVDFTEPKFLIEKKYVADITKYIKKWEHFIDFNPDLLSVVSDDKGNIYGIPAGGYSLGLMYNRTMFKNAGLDPEKPPTTWEQVREYALKLANPAKGIAGFAACSKAAQGGWHFTAMVYSWGGDLLKKVGSKWVADFSNEKAVAALEFLQTMRWEDETLTQQQMLEDKDLLQLLASGRLGMAIMAGDKLRNLKEQYQVDMNEFGMGPLPQAGGNATLTGGAAWMFNPKSSPAVLEAAVAWTVFHTFINHESDIKGQALRGQLVGWPRLPVFIGEYQKQFDAVMAKYANAPVANYRNFINASSIKVKPEPAVESKKIYTILDSVLQAVLTDPYADAERLLKTAERQAQRTVLDPLK
jgi:multiple sugar transport system substrate-binding protein